MASEPQSVDIEVRVREHELDGYQAEVVDLPGCIGYGSTPEELDESLRQAIELHLSTPEQRVEVMHLIPAQRDRRESTGRHARIDEQLESRTVELTLH